SKNNAIQRGVRSTPIKPGMLAFRIAAGTLPRAIETNTTEDETVDGSAARKKKESQKSNWLGVLTKGLNTKIRSGNRRKVVAWTKRFNRQFFRAEPISAKLSFSSSKKKLSEMPIADMTCSGAPSR